MKLINILTILISIGLKSYSQDYLRLGNKFFEEGKYLQADSLYSIGLKIFQDKDLYYNRAMARMYLIQMDGFCHDLKKASELFDQGADTLRMKNCILYDTVKVIDSSNLKYIKLIEKEKYSDRSEVRVIDTDGKEVAKYRTDKDYMVFLKCPNFAIFPLGNDKISSYLKRHVDYPKEEKDAYKKLPGSSLLIYLQFDILQTGKVSNIKVLEEKEDNYQDKNIQNFIREAIKAIQNLPEFKPGSFNNEYINCRFVTAIKFDFLK